MDITFSDIIGTFGVGCVVVAYFYVQSGKWDSNQMIFPVTNLIGAFLILVSLYNTPNIPSIIIEFVWIGISLYGMWKIRRNAKP